MLDQLPPQTALRPPSQVMRLKRMGSMFPTRLSFLRSLMRRLAADRAQVTCPLWQMNADGFGHAVISVTLGGHVYSLVAISNDLPADQRTDRVIATAWDSTFVLFDGLPDVADIDRIRANAPKQEAGRFTERDLVLSRANKSVRLWAHVVQALRQGQQPDAQMIRDVGYLMRTTAVYGNGKFGIADRALIADRPGLEGPFAAEMLTVWLIRHYTHLLVEHAGHGKLDRRVKRYLGIGNSTGLGMAPFLVNHPVLLNNWMLVRETALARVRALPELTLAQQDRLRDLSDRAAQHLQDWNVPDPAHQARIEALRVSWETACKHLDYLDGPTPLDRVMSDIELYDPEIQELMVALVLEPFGDLVDGLALCMEAPAPAPMPIVETTDALRQLIKDQFGWCLETDYSAPDACAQFWYVSEAKEEPRLGLRHSEPGAELESPLDIARRVAALWSDLPKTDMPLPEFLADHPEHALASDRVALSQSYPYAEIQDNLIADTCLPIDMLRSKLAFFGASKFDPKSNRWTRITLCQGAPLADELQGGADDWWLPTWQH